MELRRITPDEIDQVAEFAIDGMHVERYPLHLDCTKVREAVTHFQRSSTDFHLAAFESGRIVGAIAAAVVGMHWWERCEAHIVVFRSASVGAGRQLLRALMAWFDGQPMVRRLTWAFERDADPRQKRYAKRFGFNTFALVATAYKN